MIRGSRTPEDARSGLMTSFKLSEIQARAILDLRLQKLTGLERDKLKKNTIIDENHCLFEKHLGK